jgi:hypothetical protein
MKFVAFSVLMHFCAVRKGKIAYKFMDSDDAINDTIALEEIVISSEN